MGALPMVVIDEQNVVKQEPPPHGAIGMSTAYRISDAVPNRTMDFRKRVLHVGAAIGKHVINHDEVYYQDAIPGEDSNLPEWIQLTAITYKQRIAFFVDGHFVRATDAALALGGTVALGVDNGTTADFDTLIVRDTTPHDG